MAKPKTDPTLAEAVELARTQLLDIAPEDQIGEHAGVTAEEDRLLTHRFTAEKAGYRGWQWYVTVARAPRSKKVTVCELGLLPGEDALLAPAWVPWADRLKASERQAAEQSADQSPADGSAAETSSDSPSSGGQPAGGGQASDQSSR